MNKTETILRNLLENYLLKIENNSAIPFYKDTFMQDFILTEYDVKNKKLQIEIYYYSVFGHYEIIKNYNGEQFFFAKIKKCFTSDKAEQEIVRIYKDLMIPTIEIKEENISDTNENENEIEKYAKGNKILENVDFGNHAELFAKELQGAIENIFPESYVSVDVRKFLGTYSIYIRFTLGKDSTEYLNNIYNNDNAFQSIIVDGINEDLTFEPKLEVKSSTGYFLVKPDLNNPAEKYLAYGRIKTGWRDFSATPEQTFIKIVNYFQKLKDTLVENKNKLTDYTRNLVEIKKYSKGGLMIGKSHYEGGIKILEPNGIAEVEGGEIIINKEAASKNCELLSEINQSAGNGVSFPCDTVRKYSKGNKFRTSNIEIIKNQYKGKNPNDIWDSWSSSQKEHFLKDHRLFNKYHSKSFTPYNELPIDLKESIIEHINIGQYKKGTQIEEKEIRYWADFETSNEGSGELPARNSFKNAFEDAKDFYKRERKDKAVLKYLNYIGVNGQCNDFAIVFINDNYFNSLRKEFFKDEESFENYKKVAKEVLQTGKPQKGTFHKIKIKKKLSKNKK